jgi:hypothetical protein
VIRAEAAAVDRYGALDLAIDKLAERLRRNRDRRKDHRRTLVDAPVDVRPYEPQPPAEEPAGVQIAADGVIEEQLGDSPVVIRRKLHTSAAMTIDDAVEDMELVGHDFFLFVDSETSRPSVVYKRKGWSYGVVQLEA